MRRTLAQGLLVAVLTLAVGTPWALLQTAAWCGMVLTYSRTGTVAEAFAKTFDGKHPCRMCQLAQKGQADEQARKKASPADEQLQVGLAQTQSGLIHPPVPRASTDWFLFPEPRPSTPRPPPPRSG